MGSTWQNTTSPGAGGSTTHVQFNTAGLIGGSSLFVFETDKVGIRTSAPAQALTVGGNISGNAGLSATGDLVYIAKGLGLGTNFAGNLSADDYKLQIKVDDPDRLGGIRLDVNETTGVYGMYIDSESSTVAMQIEGAGICSVQDIADTYGLCVSRDIAETGTYALVTFTDDNQLNQQTTLLVKQDGTGDILNLKGLSGAVEVLTVLSAGEVGIQHTSPKPYSLTVAGHISATGNVFTSAGELGSGGGDTAKCNSVHSTVSANSGYWNQTVITVRANSGTWNQQTSAQDVYTTVNAGSAYWSDARWSSVWSTVSGNSATWFSGSTARIDNVFNVVNTSSADWNGVWTTLWQNSAYWNETANTMNTNSAAWQATANVVNVNSGHWGSSTYTLTAHSAYWSNAHWASVYSNVSANSASWALNAADVTNIAAQSASWDSAFTTVNDLSTGWSLSGQPKWSSGNSLIFPTGSPADTKVGIGTSAAGVESMLTVQGDLSVRNVSYAELFSVELTSPSGMNEDFLLEGDSQQWCAAYTDVHANSAVWDSTNVDVNANSAYWGNAHWASVYCNVSANSAAWEGGNAARTASVYTDVNANSADWETVSSYILGSSGTSAFTISGFENETGKAISLMYFNKEGEPHVSILNQDLNYHTTISDSGEHAIGLIVSGGAYFDGMVLTTGLLSSNSVIYASGGLNSDDWKSAYTTLQTQSASFVSLSASAGGWSDDGTIVRLLTPTDKVGIGTLAPTHALTVSGGPGQTGEDQLAGSVSASHFVYAKTFYTSGSANSGSSEEWTRTFTDVRNNSAGWDSTRTDVNANSSIWDQTVTTVRVNSSSWGGNGTVLQTVMDSTTANLQMQSTSRQWTYLSAAITPLSASSRIVIMVTQPYYMYTPLVGQTDVGGTFSIHRFANNFVSAGMPEWNAVSATSTNSYSGATVVYDHIGYNQQYTQAASYYQYKAQEFTVTLLDTVRHTTDKLTYGTYVRTQENTYLKYTSRGDHTMASQLILMEVL